MPRSPSSNSRTPVSLLTISCILIIALGFAVMAGWIFHISILQTVLPNQMAMRFNTALCFVVAAVGLWLPVKYNGGLISTIGMLLTVSFGVFALVTLLQTVFKFSAGIDELFIHDPDVKVYSAQPGRMSPSTALCFCLLSLGFLGNEIQNRRIKIIAQYLLHVVTLIAVISVIGYLLNVPYTLKFSFFSLMSLNTSSALLLISIAASTVNTGLGFTGLFSGGQVGNTLARKLFPRMAVILIVISYISLKLERNNYLSGEFGVVLAVVSFLLLALFLIKHTMTKMNELDMKRTSAETLTQLVNQNLGRIVQQRTSDLEQTNSDLKETQTNLQVLTDKLTNQNKQLLAFAHIISHNLRSPVSNLNLLAQFYKESENQEDREELWGNFETVIGHLNTTLDDLLETLRIQEDTAKEREQISFDAIFHQINEMLIGQVMESQAVITTDFSKAPFVLYPKMYLESIMLNLISNAIKYKSPNRNPEITVISDIDDGRIILTVKDNGLGMDMERHRKNLFGLRKTFHRHAEAKGLGLFITKTQIEAMGGEISAESEVDKGTTFKVIFNKKA